MGLLDRWSKKKTEEKLNDLKEKEIKASDVSKKKVVKSATKVVKKKEETEANVFDNAPAAPVAKKFKKGGVIVRPWVTEKNARGESTGKYCFLVDRNAGKDQVKLAIMAEYKVKPIAVNIINVAGKTVRFGRSMGRRSDYKKAVVTLPKGKTISIHEGV